jgi:MFS family permease
MALEKSDSPASTKSTLFYGYIVAGAVFVILLASFGLRFSYGVFFLPMSTELGWSNAATALAFSISAIMEGLFNIILGHLTDKYGPRIILTISSLFIGAGYCLMPMVHSVWQFYLFYGVILGAGMGGVFVPLISVVARWFRERRSAMCGLVSAGSGIGMLVVSPLATQLILTHGWRTTFLIFGISIMVVVLVAAQFLKLDPSRMGLQPDGRASGPKDSGPHTITGHTFKEAFRTYQIWIVCVIFFMMGFYVASNQIYLVPDAVKSGMSSTHAAFILSTYAIVNIIGMAGLGALADKTGNKSIFILGFALEIVASAIVASSHASASFFIFAVIVGLAAGGMGALMSPLVASLFGLRSLGLIFGFCGFCCTIGQACGPYITGVVLDRTQNYQIALGVCGVAAIIGLLAIILLKPVKKYP